jgi:GNAT superfamily N-acetyltransferase
MIAIGYANESDKERLFSLFSQWDDDNHFDYAVFSESFDRILSDTGNRILVAREEDAIVGYVQFFPVDELGFRPFVEIAEFLVAPEVRSRGIGAALLERVEDTARANGIACLKLSSQTFRERAHAFYERHGFRNFKNSRFYEKTL